MSDPTIHADDLLYQADALAALTCWIESARHILDRIQDVSGYNAKLKRQLEAAQILYGDPAWGGEQSEGLRYVYSEIRDRVRGASHD